MSGHAHTIARAFAVALVPGVVACSIDAAGPDRMDAWVERDAAPTREASAADDAPDARRVDARIDAGEADDAGADVLAPEDVGASDTGVDVGPRCDDGVHNGGESDMDCGGSCGPCALCARCARDSDCMRGHCGPAGRCGVGVAVSIDARAMCVGTGSGRPVIARELPAGRYVVTATGGAMSWWNGPYSPPGSGWSYHIPCDLPAPNATPPATNYEHPQAAFAAVSPVSAELEITDGELRCAVIDGNCMDNHGALAFRVDYVCP